MRPVLMFQSTPPREGRLTSIKRMLSNILFQSTPPHEGRLDAIIGALIQTEFQSTPPRGRRQLVVDHGCSLSVVSIHAPARGATLQSQSLRQFQVVSIHAPARGATAACIFKNHVAGSFNPRPRAGGDSSSGSRASTLYYSFNPRPRAGGDTRWLD